MNEAVSRRWIDRFDDFANLVDVDLVRKLRPEDDARSGKVAPDRARRFDAGKLWHLDVEDADIRLFAERELHSLLAVRCLKYGYVRRKLFLQNLAQVVALGHVVF